MVWEAKSFDDLINKHFDDALNPMKDKSKDPNFLTTPFLKLPNISSVPELQPRIQKSPEDKFKHVLDSIEKIKPDTNSIFNSYLDNHTCNRCGKIKHYELKINIPELGKSSKIGYICKECDPQLYEEK